ncbi:MAG: hypothetical protein OXC37_02250 [Bdellovibrionaceae bacterium]|nr:hypothetical protein [Pseudobdellovibrionaceae bacterium]
MYKFIFPFVFLFLSFSSNAVYNLKTNKEAEPKIGEKHWILVAQACHSCDEVLKSLNTFCEGKKPQSLKVGFFITGSSQSKMIDKLNNFKTDYEIFSGSPNEFSQNYKLGGAPALRSKDNKIVYGKAKILEFLKKDSQFCENSA